MPVRPLPDDPSFEHLRKQAKRLHDAVHANIVEAQVRVREFHPRPERALARFTRDGRDLALFYYEGRQIYSLDGVRANHFLQHARIDLLVPLHGSMGIGTSAEFFHRRSYYQDAQRTIKTYHYPQVRAYLTWRRR